MIDFRVTPQEAGERIDLVLARRAGVTRTLAQRAVRNGTVRVSGEEVRPSRRLEPGEEVTGIVERPEIAAPLAEDIPLKVCYSDARLLVVSKPSGLVTHPARGNERGTLVNALLALEGPLSRAGSIRPGIVHRLDKDTSGLLLVARDDAAQEFLVDALRARRIERHYLALVGGIPPPSGTVEAPIGRHPRRRTMMAVVPGGRPSVTHYRMLSSGASAALLDVRLETGRTHQIRVHLSNLGHPILGDRTYGGRGEASLTLGLTRPFLHAYRLSFPHPDDGRTVTVTDELPADLLGAAAAAGIDVPPLS